MLKQNHLMRSESFTQFYKQFIKINSSKHHLQKLTIMTTKVFTLIVAALFFCSLSFATIRRVGYPGIQLSGVDYADLQSANDAANAGDTIQIYSSSATSGTINKQLVIIGFGYNLATNTGLQAIGTSAPSSAAITCGVGSNGTIVEGISGPFQISDLTGSTTPISNITFERCNGSFSFLNYNGYGLISNITIISCVVQSVQFGYNPPGSNPVTNLQIYNCIIEQVTLYDPGTTALIENCVTVSPVYTYSNISLNDAQVLVNNCILGYSNSTANVNTVYNNNFFGDSQPTSLPAGTNNRWGQDWGAIFNRLGGTNDAAGLYNDPTFAENYYILKAGSPAINGGFNGANAATDCGIFGGEAAYVYKLSGVPAVPAIYTLTAPGTAASANPYNITISVRSNN